MAREKYYSSSNIHFTSHANQQQSISGVNKVNPNNHQSRQINNPSTNNPLNNPLSSQIPEPSTPTIRRRANTCNRGPPFNRISSSSSSFLTQQPSYKFDPISSYIKQSQQTKAIHEQYIKIHHIIDMVDEHIRRRIQCYENEVVSVIQGEIEQMREQTSKVVEEFNTMIEQKNKQNQIWSLNNELDYFRAEAQKLYEGNQVFKEENRRLRRENQEYEWELQNRDVIMQRMLYKYQKEKFYRNKLKKESAKANVNASKDGDIVNESVHSVRGNQKADKELVVDGLMKCETFESEAQKIKGKKNKTHHNESKLAVQQQASNESLNSSIYANQQQSQGALANSGAQNNKDHQSVNSFVDRIRNKISEASNNKNQNLLNSPTITPSLNVNQKLIAQSNESLGQVFEESEYGQSSNYRSQSSVQGSFDLESEQRQRQRQTFHAMEVVDQACQVNIYLSENNYLEMFRVKPSGKKTAGLIGENREKKTKNMYLKTDYNSRELRYEETTATGKRDLVGNVQATDSRSGDKMDKIPEIRAFDLTEIKKEKLQRGIVAVEQQNKKQKQSTQGQQALSVVKKRPIQLQKNGFYVKDVGLPLRQNIKATKNRSLSTKNKFPKTPDIAHLQQNSVSPISHHNLNPKAKQRIQTSPGFSSGDMNGQSDQQHENYEIFEHSQQEGLRQQKNIRDEMNLGLIGTGLDKKMKKNKFQYKMMTRFEQNKLKTLENANLSLRQCI